MFIDAVPPNLGRLNVDRGGKDMTGLDFSNTYPLSRKRKEQDQSLVGVY